MTSRSTLTTNIFASALYSIRLFFPKGGSGAENSPGRKSLLGAMICIGISLIPLVAVLVVSDGMIKGITGRIIGLSTQDICVHINTSSPSVSSGEDLEALSARLSCIEGVNQAWPEIEGMALAVGANSRVGATVRAVEPDVFFKNESFSSLFSVIEGTPSLSTENSCIIGQKIASDLNLHAGDKIRLVGVKNTNGRFIPKTSQYTVSGIVSCGYQELDALWVFIPLKDGFASMSLPSSRFVISLVTDNPFSPDLMRIKFRVREDLSGLSSNAPIEKSYVYTWNELNSAQYENFASTKVLLLLIMLLIVLVASVNVSSALIMIVMERRKEIAILKSLGSSSRGVAASFLLMGLIAGVGGVVIGVPLGLLTSININPILHIMEKCVNIFIEFIYMIFYGNIGSYMEVKILDPAYYLQEIPISIPFRELLIIVLGTLFLSLVVSFIPAVKAGKEKPLETLRKM